MPQCLQYNRIQMRKAPLERCTCLTLRSTHPTLEMLASCFQIRSASIAGQPRAPRQNRLLCMVLCRGIGPCLARLTLHNKPEREVSCASQTSSVLLRTHSGQASLLDLREQMHTAGGSGDIEKPSESSLQPLYVHAPCRQICVRNAHSPQFGLHRECLSDARGQLCCASRCTALGERSALAVAARLSCRSQSLAAMLDAAAWLQASCHLVASFGSAC